MKKVFYLLILFLTIPLNAQTSGKGIITGKILDMEMEGAALPFANVIIKNTSQGTISDENGNFTIENVPEGSHMVVFSFIGYEKVTVPQVKVTPGKETMLNVGLEAASANLDEIIITTVLRKDTQTASLLKQKNALMIEENIGAQELAGIGVSNVATATTKISGVSKSEASGDIYIRGLGDRYLQTTLNGLPLPSDDTERKNIDLSIFPVSLIQSIGISKSFSAGNSADQASGSINISTRKLSGMSALGFGVKTGINSAVIPVAENFLGSPSSENFKFGFSPVGPGTKEAVVGQSWEPQKLGIPLDLRYSFHGGRKIKEDFEFLVTGRRSTTYNYRKGRFREYRSNFLTTSFSDAELFSKTTNTTGAISLGYEPDGNNEISAISILINSLEDGVYTAGKNGDGFVFEETSATEGLSQFVRDQKTEQTLLWVSQLSGRHQLNENNKLSWALGLNLIEADQPLRTRNEVNFKEGLVQLGRTGGFQQRKSTQKLSETEFNGTVFHSISLLEKEKNSFELVLGGDFRRKKRSFFSSFTGVEEKNTNILNPGSLNELPEIFSEINFENGLLLLNELQPDRYQASLNSTSGFITGNFTTEDWNFNMGLRYQNDRMDLSYDIGNIPGRTGASELAMAHLYPALNIKFQYSERTNFRLAASRTFTLPEFKEIAPFEYVSQTGEVTRGNPELQPSSNYNLDLKWEYFPSSSQLLSLSGIYKIIRDPINKVRDRGSAGVYSYFNSGERAEIYGLELELNLSLLPENLESELDLNFNIARLWHRQDLKVLTDKEGNLLRTFRYNHLEEIGLEGASNLILNSYFTFRTLDENPLVASVTGSYSSDKIFALGAPEIQTRSDTYYNSEIIEEGFLKLGAVVTKEFGNWKLQLSAKNLLNPLVKRTQQIRPATTEIQTRQLIRSYRLGTEWGLGLTYNL